MLKLRAGADDVAPAVPSNAVAWRDRDGAVAAYGFTAGEEHWIRVPGVGSFSFTGASDDVRSLSEPGVPAAAVFDTFRRTVVPFALQALGYEVLHASAVRIDRGVVALCAASLTGKSTVAYALSRRGHRLFADDALTFDLASATPRASAPPFELHLRREAAEFLSAPRSVPSEERAGATLPLAALCMLERAGSSTLEGRPVRVQELSPAAAFPRVLEHAYCFSLEPVERRRSMLERYLELAERVPAFEVRIRTGLENLGPAIEAIEDATRARGAEAWPGRRP